MNSAVSKISSTFSHSLSHYLIIYLILSFSHSLILYLILSLSHSFTHSLTSYFTSSPMFCLFTYPFTSIPESIPSSFLRQCPSLVNALNNDYYSRQEAQQSLLLSYTTPNDCSVDSIPSIIPFFTQYEFDRPSLVYKTVCFVPSSKAQAACLDALTIRWQYLLNE